MGWADGTSSIPSEDQRNSLKHKRCSGFFLLILIAVILLASCGNGDEENEATPTRASSPPRVDALRTSEQDFLSCFVELNPTGEVAPTASPTPEVINVQVLERPYRIVPNNIVLHKNRTYELVITAGNEWHLLASELLNEDLLLPPGSQHSVLLRPDRLGVFTIADHRKIRESETLSTFTVILERASEVSGYPLCVEFQISSPSPDATLVAPFIVQGSVGTTRFELGETLYVVRVEAWSNGELVGTTSRDEFIRNGPYSEFLLSVPTLPPGPHSLILRAYLQSGMVAATSILPLSVLGDASSGDLIPGYRGSIDAPNKDAVLSLPVTIQGWVVIPSRRNGTGVGTVEIWNGPRQTGTFLTEAIYGIYRPDVARTLDHPRFASSGFIAQLSDLPAGTAELHVYVRDRQSGEYLAPRLLESELTRPILLAEGKVTDAAWPVALAAAPDGKLFYAELLTGNIRIVARWAALCKRHLLRLVDVSTHAESGLLGSYPSPELSSRPIRLRHVCRG